MHTTKQFTKEEKDACLPMVSYLSGCAYVACYEGILQLEEFVKDSPNYFLVFLISLLTCESYKDGITEELGEILLAAEDYTGQELLERILIFKSVQLFLHGNSNPRIVNVTLLCLLGESYLKEAYTTGSIHEYSGVSKLEEFVNEYSLPECIIFDSGIQTLSDEDMKRTFGKMAISRSACECMTAMDVAKILKGCGKATAKKIDSAIPPVLQPVVIHHMDGLGEMEICDILEAQDRLVLTIKELVRCGEIKLIKGAFDQVIFRVVEKNKNCRRENMH